MRNRHHPSIALIVVRFIGWFALFGLGGILMFLYALAARGREVPVEQVALLSTLATLVGTALGALGSMLTQTKTEDTAVRIANAPSDPVPVTTADAAPAAVTPPQPDIPAPAAVTTPQPDIPAQAQATTPSPDIPAQEPAP